MPGFCRRRGLSAGQARRGARRTIANMQGGCQGNSTKRLVERRRSVGPAKHSATLARGPIRPRGAGYAEVVACELELSSELLLSSSLLISVGQTLPSGSLEEQEATSSGMELSLFMSSETVTNS